MMTQDLLLSSMATEASKPRTIGRFGFDEKRNKTGLYQRPLVPRGVPRNVMDSLLMWKRNFEYSSISRLTNFKHYKYNKD